MNDWVHNPYGLDLLEKGSNMRKRCHISRFPKKKIAVTQGFAFGRASRVHLSNWNGLKYPPLWGASYYQGMASAC